MVSLECITQMPYNLNNNSPNNNSDLLKYLIKIIKLRVLDGNK